MWLFSYGSNHPAQLAERLGRKVKTRAASLEGYERVFRGWSQNWGGGVASLQPKRGAVVYGLVAKVSSADLAKMDRFEGIASGNYKRKKLPVVLGDGTNAMAVAYVSTSTEKNAPTHEYLQAVAKTIGAHWRGDSGAVSWRDVTVREEAQHQADEEPRAPHDPLQQLEFIVAPDPPFPVWLTLAGDSWGCRVVARVLLSEIEEILREDWSVGGVLSSNKAAWLLRVLDGGERRDGQTVYSSAVRYFKHGERFVRYGRKKGKYGIWAGMKLHKKETIFRLLQAFTIVEPDTHSTVWLFNLDTMKADRILTLWELIQPTWEKHPGKRYGEVGSVAFRPEKGHGPRGWQDPGPGDPPALWPLSERQWEEGEWPSESVGGPPAARYGMEAE